MQYTQMLGPFVPNLTCWIVLLVTLAALGLSFYLTNVTAFARHEAGGRKPTSGSRGLGIRH